MALGRARLLLPAGGVAVRGRARPARSAPRRGRTAGRGGPRPGIAPVWDRALVRPGRHGGAPPAGHRPDRPGAVGGRRSRRARPRGQRRRAGAVDRAGRSGSPPGSSAGGARPRARGTRPGPAGPSSSGAAPAPGRPCRGWPPPSSSTRTTRPTGRRARPPTARSTWSSSGRADRPRRASSSRRCRPWRSPPTTGLGRWPRGARGARRLGRPSSGSTAVGRTRAPACSPRSSSAWPAPCSTTRAAAARGPLVCVYNRTGGARLLACRHCGELARCTRCGAAAARPRDEEVLRCPRCGDTRPVVCAACGRLRMKTLRAGREPPARGAGGAARGRGGGGGRARVAGSAEPALPDEPGAGGHRGGAAPGAPRRGGRRSWTSTCTCSRARLSATEDTLALFVRAARLVGGRGTGPAWARVQVQTRVPDHPVLRAVWRGEPAPVLDEEASGASPVGSAAVRRAGARVGRARTGLRRGAGGGGRGRARRHRRPGCRHGVAAGRGTVPGAAPTRTSRCATCWPGCPGRPGVGCGSRWTRPASRARGSGRRIARGRR